SLREEGHEESILHPGPGCPDPGDALDKDREAGIPIMLLGQRPAPDRGAESFGEREPGAAGELGGSGCMLVRLDWVSVQHRQPGSEEEAERLHIWMRPARQGEDLGQELSGTWLVAGHGAGDCKEHSGRYGGFMGVDLHPSTLTLGQAAGGDQRLDEE